MNIFNLDKNSLNIGLGNDNRYTNGEFSLLREVIKDGYTVFDVGSNRGDWAKDVLGLAKLKELVCFEPVPETFTMLRKALADFPCVRCINCAVTDKTDKADMYWYKNNISYAEMSNLYGRPDVESRLNLKVEKFETLTLALDDYDLAFKKIDYLKIDAEGAELYILKGAKTLLGKKKIISLQFEYGGCAKDSNSTLKEMFEILQKNGYGVARIIPDGLILIEKWDDVLENYTHSNYFATINKDLLKR